MAYKFLTAHLSPNRSDPVIFGQILCSDPGAVDYDVEPLRQLSEVVNTVLEEAHSLLSQLIFKVQQVLLRISQVCRVEYTVSGRIYIWVLSQFDKRSASRSAWSRFGIAESEVLLERTCIASGIYSTLLVSSS